MVEIQGKSAYNRHLWSGPSLDPAHSVSFSASNSSSCPYHEFAYVLPLCFASFENHEVNFIDDSTIVLIVI